MVPFFQAKTVPTKLGLLILLGLSVNFRRGFWAVNPKCREKLILGTGKVSLSSVLPYGLLNWLPSWYGIVGFFVVCFAGIFCRIHFKTSESVHESYRKPRHLIQG